MSHEVQERFQAAFLEKSVSLGNTFCEGCRRRTYSRVEGESDLATAAAQERASTSSDISDSMDVDFQAPLLPPVIVECIEIGFQRVVATERRCFVCGSSATRPTDVKRRIDVKFVKRRIYITKSNRCCTEHLIRGKFFEDVLSHLSVASNTSVLDAKEVKEYMELISQDSGATLKNQLGDQ